MFKIPLPNQMDSIDEDRDIESNEPKTDTDNENNPPAGGSSQSGNSQQPLLLLLIPAQAKSSSTKPSVDLSSAITAALQPLFNNKELMDRVCILLPPSSDTSSTIPSDQLRSTVQSPQFQQSFRAPTLNKEVADYVRSILSRYTSSHQPDIDDLKIQNLQLKEKSSAHSECIRILKIHVEWLNSTVVSLLEQRIRQCRFEMLLCEIGFVCVGIMAVKKHLFG